MSAAGVGEAGGVLGPFAARRAVLARPARAPAEVGALLEAAGDLLRRSERLPAPAAEVQPALARLPEAALLGWLERATPEALAHELKAALGEAAETWDPDAPEEGEGWGQLVVERLLKRDAAESAARALLFWEVLHGELTGRGATLRMRFLEALGRVDEGARPRARWLVGLNPQRRAHRDVLDAPERGLAWWWAERSDCDALLVALGVREGSAAAHLAACGACRADVARGAEEVARPPPRHLDAELLWRWDVGELDAESRAWVQRHADACARCRAALDAVREGDAFVDEALELDAEAAAAPPPARPGAGRTAARPREARRVLAERREFRVVLEQGPRGARLLVQPLREGRGLAATATLGEGRAPLRPLSGPDGLAFEVGAARAVHLRVTVGGQSWDADLDLR